MKKKTYNSNIPKKVEDVLKTLDIDMMDKNVSSFEDELKELDRLHEKISKEYPDKKDEYIYDNEKINPDDAIAKAFFEKYKLAIPYNDFRAKRKFSFWNSKQKRIYEKKLDVSVCVHMELNNGFHRTFLVVEDRGGFKFMTGYYIFDNKLKYYDVDKKIYCYDYHQNFPLPFKRIFPLKEIKQDMMNKGNVTDMREVEYALNPRTLKDWIVSNIIEAMLQGGMLYKLLIILLVITAIAGIITLVGMGINGYWNYKSFKMLKFVVTGIEALAS